MTKAIIQYITTASCAVVLMSGCASRKPAPTPVPVKPKSAFTWDAAAAKSEKGPAAIIVDMSEQRAYFYKGTTLIGDTKCSSGKRGFDTPPGEYQVTQKDPKHESNLYGDFVNDEGVVTRRNVDTSKQKPADGETFIGAKMPFYMRFTGGYGLHAGIVPNRPASHGCVRLPRVMAEHFYKNAQTGTPVTVQE
jgi:lipoprotein-anchoring transpeptidase ErfK/SrfK